MKMDSEGRIGTTVYIDDRIYERVLTRLEKILGKRASQRKMSHLCRVLLRAFASGKIEVSAEDLRPDPNPGQFSGARQPRRSPELPSKAAK